jgi:hypothetical protein
VPVADRPPRRYFRHARHLPLLSLFGAVTAFAEAAADDAIGASEPGPVPGRGWFSSRHLLEPIGYMPPAESEAEYYRAASASAETQHML